MPKSPRKSSDGQGETCKVFPHDSGGEASGSKVLSPLQIFKKLFTPKSGEQTTFHHDLKLELEFSN